VYVSSNRRHGYVVSRLYADVTTRAVTIEFSQNYWKKYPRTGFKKQSTKFWEIIRIKVRGIFIKLASDDNYLYSEYPPP